MLNRSNIETSSIDLMEMFQSKTESKINCHNIGKIVKFYSETQTADIQIQQIKTYLNELYTPVLLTDVPVFIYGCANAHITLPDPTGSTCILLFMDRNIDAYLQTGEMYVPSTTRMHDITDCIALLTFKTQVDTIEDYDTQAITIKYGSSNIKVKNDGVIINSPIGVTIDSPEVSTTGNLNAGTGVTTSVACGQSVLTFTNGILTGVS